MYFGDYRLSKTCLDHSLKELIPSAKSRRARGAFQQPAFMSDCLFISHTCLPSLLGKGTLVYKRCLLVVEGGGGGLGNVAEWWVWRVGKVCELNAVPMEGKVCEWSEVAQWERWENSEVARSERSKRNEVAIWERWEGSEQRRWDPIWEQNCVVLLQGSTFIIFFPHSERKWFGKYLTYQNLKS